MRALCFIATAIKTEVGLQKGLIFCGQVMLMSLVPMKSARFSVCDGSHKSDSPRRFVSTVNNGMFNIFTGTGGL